MKRRDFIKVGIGAGIAGAMLPMIGSAEEKERTRRLVTLFNEQVRLYEYALDRGRYIFRHLGKLNRNSINSKFRFSPHDSSICFEFQSLVDNGNQHQASRFGILYGDVVLNDHIIINYALNDAAREFGYLLGVVGWTESSVSGQELRSKKYLVTKR